MMSLTFGLFTQVSGLGPLGPLVYSMELCSLHNFKTVQGIFIKLGTNLKHVRKFAENKNHNYI